MKYNSKKSKRKPIEMDKKIQLIYRRACDYLNEGHITDAVDVLKTGIPLLRKIEACFFDDVFQLLLWVNLHHPQKKGFALPDTNLFYLLGYALVEINDFETAKNYFQSALKINPCDVNSRFEIMDILKKEKDLEGILKTLQDTYNYIYTPVDMARLYRYYGWVFIEIEAWRAAIATYFLSALYADEAGIESAEGGLGYIEEVTGKEIDEPDDSEMEALAAEYHFPLGPNAKVLDIMYETSEELKNNGDGDMAVAFYGAYVALYGGLSLNCVRDIIRRKDNEYKDIPHAAGIFAVKSEAQKEESIISYVLKIYHRVDADKYFEECFSFDFYQIDEYPEIKNKILSSDGEVDITEDMERLLCMDSMKGDT